MKLIEKTIIEFINEIDSPSPVPGGGSVSALIGSLGVSLSKMVGHLTINKKKFKGLSNKIQEEFIKRLDELGVIKDELNVMIDKRYRGI